MFPISRLQKALRRQGIAVAYANGIYTLSNPHAQASVLLPHHFPLEEKAVRQLLEFASVAVPGQDGHVCKACATPDFHPGSIAPVGSIVATTPDMVIPAIPGTDIACGMRLITTGLTLAQFESRKDAIMARLRHVLLEDGRNVPLRSKAFAALFDAGPAALIDSVHDDGLWSRVDKERLVRERDACIALRELGGGLRHAPEALVGTREVIRDPSLGTTGSGNHFVEIQVVDAVLDRHAAWHHGLASWPGGGRSGADDPQRQPRRGLFCRQPLDGPRPRRLAERRAPSAVGPVRADGRAGRRLHGGDGGGFALCLAQSHRAGRTGARQFCAGVCP